MVTRGDMLKENWIVNKGGCHRSVLFLEYLLYQVWNIEDRICNGYSRRLQSLDLALCRSCVARNDCSCMAHALARRCGATGDEGYHGLAHSFDEFRRVLFVAAADLAAHDYRPRLGIVVEELEVVRKC